MGFGSYDESEQENQEMDVEDDDEGAVNVHEDAYEGEMSFESGASADALVEQLQDIKGEDTEE